MEERGEGAARKAGAGADANHSAGTASVGAVQSFQPAGRHHMRRGARAGGGSECTPAYRHPTETEAHAGRKGRPTHAEAVARIP